MTEEEMTIEFARSMRKHGFASPRRTDLVWKIRLFMRQFGVGDRSPKDLIKALDAAGLKIVHGDVGAPKERTNGNI